MEVKFYGGNCLRLITKKTRIIIDDSINKDGKALASDDEVLVRTFPSDQPTKARFLVDGPGDYEVSEVSIKGVPARAHIEEQGKFGSTIYKIVIDDIRVAVIGHVYPDFSEDQVEALGIVDVMIVPVGGNGYTLDGIGASKLIRKIEPKIVIPTHYNDGHTRYEVPQADLEQALIGLGLQTSDRQDSLKIKSGDISLMVDGSTKLVVLELSK